MAEPTPWQLSQPKQPTVRHIEHFVRDPYNFSYPSTSQGTNPVVVIPADGPHAAGAIPPSKFPEIASVEVIVTGSAAPTYGVNW